MKEKCGIINAPVKKEKVKYTKYLEFFSDDTSCCGTSLLESRVILLTEDEADDHEWPVVDLKQVLVAIKKRPVRPYED
jgi:hypothetical protein